MSESSPTDPCPRGRRRGPGACPGPAGVAGAGARGRDGLAGGGGRRRRVDRPSGGGPARLDLFPDTNIYWELARAIRAGGPYEYVEWGDIPHFAIRTPGYPLFLAACQAVFGERTLPVRLVQAALGTLCVYLVYRLARQLVPAAIRASRPPRPDDSGPSRSSPAAVAAINPHYLMMSALVLSEAAFEPLMLAALLGVAVLWPAHGSRRRADRGAATGWSRWAAARPRARRCWCGRRGRCSSR